MAVDSGQTALAKYSSSAILDKAEAREILMTIWPDAPETELVKAALLCKQYGLNPLMKHLYLVGYKSHDGMTWSIQIGIGATRMIARRSGAYAYEDDSPRLMTEVEQIKIMGAVDKNRFWAITKLRGKDGMTAQGYGNWPKDTAVKGADKGNTPQNMAFIRSERAALDKLFPEKLPAGMEVVASEYQETPQVIDTDTGEITEGQSEPVKLVVERPVKTEPPTTTTKQPEAMPEGNQGLSDRATEVQRLELVRLGRDLKYRDDQIMPAVLSRLEKKTFAECNKLEVAQVINDWSKASAERGKPKAQTKQPEFEEL